jgi:hypothetical protein
VETRDGVPAELRDEEEHRGEGAEGGQG